MTSVARQQRYHAGRWAEHLACLLLWVKGYKVLARRKQTPVGEIDIVARRGTSLIIVEVKARSSLAEAMTAITPRQQQRLLRAARFIMAGADMSACETIRCDAILFVPGRWPRHIINAWQDA